MSTGFLYEYRTRKALKKATTEILRTQEKESLRRIQEPEYRTEKITTLVYVVQDCVTPVPGYRSRGPGFDSRRCQIF
jgi:hypothetical protein